MAKMFPEWINEDQRQGNPKFRAEFRVYDLLEKNLSDEWYVFYSRTWTWVENVSNRLRMREADFIIAHPDYGIMLMEVKGGNIEVQNGQWISTDRYGNSWNINPYEQVAIAASSLDRRLSDEPVNPFKNYRFSTAVCFPDVSVTQYSSQLGPNHSRITIDAQRMGNLLNAIIEIMKGPKGEFDPPGTSRILIIKELIACSWYINAPKFIQITDTENEIKRLTENQFKLLYQIAPSTQKLLVSGCAGSGKTMLAAEIARRIVLFEKKKVLFTCYNRNLATWIRASSFFVDNGLMMVTNYHKLCADFAHHAGITLPVIEDKSHQKTDPIFRDVYPNILLEIVEKIGEQFDVIIVDEGQDFYDNWWLSLQLLLKENGRFHVYYDPCQWLWGEEREIPLEISLDATKIELTENVRNTKLIHNLAMQFHPSSGNGYKALCNLGIEPEFVPIPPGKKEHQVVLNLIERLVNEDQVPIENIAILSPLSMVEGNSYWKANKALLGKYRLVHNLGISSHELFYSSIGAAKGLEFPVVILTELHSSAIHDEVKNYMAHLYTGISRARSHLIILSDYDEFESIAKE